MCVTIVPNIDHMKPSILWRVSDITVIRAGQTWKLHRAVICPRCRYFHNTFSNNFQVHTVLRNLGSWVTLRTVLGSRDWIGGVG